MCLSNRTCKNKASFVFLAMKSIEQNLIHGFVQQIIQLCVGTLFFIFNTNCGDKKKISRKKLKKYVQHNEQNMFTFILSLFKSFFKIIFTSKFNIVLLFSIINYEKRCVPVS